MPKVVLKPAANYDLLPKNPMPVFLKLDSTAVNVEIQIETKSPNSAKTDRWTKVAEAEMANYREIVVDTTAKVIAKWEGKPVSERKKDAETLSASINKALLSMEGAIEKAVREQIKREAQGDKNLLEARIAVAAKGTFKVLAIGKDVAEVVVTGAADISAWISLAKDIVALAKIIEDQCKNEPQLRDDLLKSIGSYCTVKQRRWDEEKKAKDWKAKAKLLAKEIWTSQKSLAANTESARKKYRNEVTAMIQKVDGVGGKRDKLQAELKKSGQADAKGIAGGKQMVNLGTAVKTMNTRILECQGFADDMAMLLTEAGVDVDDSTALQKIKKLRDLGSLKEAAKEIYGAAKSLQDIIEAMQG